MGRRRRLAAALAALAAIAGCSPAPGAQGSSYFKPAHPVTVTEHLDAAKGVSATVDSAGGTLTATSSAGVRYTLVIPKDAVVFSTPIRMTPVASLDGLPFHALLAAVHIEPEGLTLFHPATLTIEGAPAVAAGDAPLGLIYEHGGDNLHLYPLASGSGLQLNLTHFSSPGVADGNQQQLNAQLQHAPQTNLAQEEQAMADLVARARSGQLNAGGQPINSQQLAAQLQKVLDAFKREVVDPEVAAATAANSSFETVFQALSDVFKWERTAELFGVSNPAYQGILDKLLAQLPRLYREEIDRCVKNKDENAGLRAFAVARFSALLGRDIPLDLADQCLHIKVNVDSNIKTTTTVGGEMAEVKVTDAPGGLMKPGEGGSAPPVYAAWSFQVNRPPPMCTITSTTKVTGAAQVLGVENVSLSYEGADRFTLKDFTLDLTPGESTDTVVTACPGIGASETTNTFFNSNWEHLHGSEQTSRNGLVYYAISGWKIGTGAQFATKEYSQTKTPVPQLTVDESTTITVGLA